MTGKEDNRDVRDCRNFVGVESEMSGSLVPTPVIPAARGDGPSEGGEGGGSGVAGLLVPTRSSPPEWGDGPSAEEGPDR